MSDNYVTPPYGSSDDGSWAKVMPVPDRYPFHWNGIAFWGLPIPLQPPDNYEVYGLCASETWYRLTRTGSHSSGWQLVFFRVGDEQHIQTPTRQGSFPALSAQELFAVVGVLVREGVTWDDLTRRLINWNQVRWRAAAWTAGKRPAWTETL